MADGTLPSVDNTISSISYESHGTIMYTAKEQITAYGSIYGMALFCIVIGSIRSLYFVQKHMRKKRLIETSITVNEAKKFPLTASCVLFGLYIFFGCGAECWQRMCSVLSSYLPPKLSKRLETFPILTNATDLLVTMEGDSSKTLFQKALDFLPLINQVNAMYMLLMLLCWEGCVALAAILKPVFSFVLRKLPIGNHQPKMNYPYFWSLKRGKMEMEEGDVGGAADDDFECVLKVEWDTHDIVAIVCCLCVGISHLYRRHWITNNILGVAFSIYGTMLLAGLFIYDVFWVFATDVMTTVAKVVDAPLLLQFPQDIYRHGVSTAGKHAMLDVLLVGLGDIVIPGIFIALLRRFDHYIGSGGNYKKPRHYFFITTVAYCFGLMITIVVMHFFKAAQPAMLYLVPTCVLVPLAVAGIRGEAHEMLSYCEEHLVEKNQPKKLRDEKKTD